MPSISLVNFLAEKMYSFSSKVRGDHYGTSFLMDGNSNSTQQYNPFKVLNEVRGNGMDADISNPFYPNISLIQSLGILGANHSSKFHHNTEKQNIFDDLVSYGVSGRFSPHLLNLVNLLNPYLCRHSCSDISLMHSVLFGHMMNSFNESLISKTPEVKQNSAADSDLEKNCDPMIRDLEISVNVNCIPKMKSEVADEKRNLSNSIQLNLKLARRKTKQMNKRSKKRRHRQKKSQQLIVNNSLTMSVDHADGSLPSPVSSPVCFIAKSPDFESTMSVKYDVQISPCISSFVMPVEGNSDDDSDWESYDETDRCATSSLTSDSEVDSNDPLSSSDSSVIESESTESNCSPLSNYSGQITSSIFSFVIPVEDSSDDDSEWDSSESSTVTETSEFEFTGLFLTNLCTPRTSSSNSESSLTAASEDETDESLQLRNILLEVNENWNKHTKGDDIKAKSSSKVRFAPDEELVEVFPVEICERKGEWEIYATERLRFKRKIDELEKVLSPCLNPEHRSKIFKKLMESEL